MFVLFIESGDLVIELLALKGLTCELILFWRPPKVLLEAVEFVLLMWLTVLLELGLLPLTKLETLELLMLLLLLLLLFILALRPADLATIAL